MKSGTEVPIMAIKMHTKSSFFPLLRAAIIPSTSPKEMDITSALIPRSKEYGKEPLIVSITVRFVYFMEYPRSP
jgi:hypothetical protein